MQARSGGAELLQTRSILLDFHLSQSTEGRAAWPARPQVAPISQWTPPPGGLTGGCRVSPLTMTGPIFLPSQRRASGSLSGPNPAHLRLPTVGCMRTCRLRAS
ncbi:hypothetical protein NDU88_003063 [Pleurodeles waltl]|uniref:Uncharacterized protein n=1 Tax=Pleurodeles waltl TaxID=8319 RepID=A0AAV7QEF1_PLEWA|nr:hypothetical protein NDU88_003063 [Pleurodeles waltl]